MLIVCLVTLVLTVTTTVGTNTPFSHVRKRRLTEGRGRLHRPAFAQPINGRTKISKPGLTNTKARIPSNLWAWNGLNLCKPTPSQGTVVLPSCPPLLPLTALSQVPYCYLQEMRVSEWASDLFPSALTVMAWITLMASTPTQHKVLDLKAALVSSDLFKDMWATQAQKDPQLPRRSQSYFKKLRASLCIDDTDTETFRGDCRQSQKPKTSG